MAKYLFVVCVELVVSALLPSGFIAAPCFHSESPANVPAVLLRLTRMKSGFARVFDWPTTEELGFGHLRNWVKQLFPSLTSFCSEHTAVSGLLELLVVDHLVLQGHKNFFHGVLLLPLSEHGELADIDAAVALVDTWQVDFACELYLRLNLRVLGSALDCKEVDSVIEVSVRGADNGTVPLSE